MALQFEADLTDPTRLNLLDAPGRSDSQGPRLASNVEYIVEPDLLGVPDIPPTPGTPDSWRDVADSTSDVLDYARTDTGSVIRTVVTTTTSRLLIPGQPGDPGQPGTPATPGDSYLRIHSRPSVDRRLAGGQGWASGGVMFAGQAFTYGRVAARLRASASVGTRVCALLWPTGPWPAAGEIDYFEIGADHPARDAFTVTNHYADPAAPKVNRQWVKGVHVDCTSWHDIELLWAPDLIVVSVDGQEQARGTAHIPDGPMWPGFQTAQGSLHGEASRTPGTLDIAGFAIYDS